MKILFVNNSRGRGGGEEFLRDLLPGLAAKGAIVGLICRPNTHLVDMFRDTGVNIHSVDRSGMSGITSVFKIAKIIRNEGYTIIDIQRGYDIIQSWVASLLSLKKPVLLYTPQVPEFYKLRFFLNRMSRIITISRYIKDKLIAYHRVLAARIDIIYYGINLALFKPDSTQRGSFRSKHGISLQTMLIGTVGDLWKNQIEFLDALPFIQKTYPDVRFALVASTEGVGQIREFEKRSEKLGVSNALVWTGRLSKEEMQSFYADIDVAVCTHRNEGFGIWILEALAMGKPVVAFNAGGVRDSLEGCPAGVLVDGGAQEMAAEVVRLLGEKDRYAQMTNEGPRWVTQKFNRDRMIDDYLRYFETLETGHTAYAMRSAQNPLNILMMISKNDRYGAQRIFLDQVKVMQAMGNRVVVVGRGSEGYVPESIKAMGVEYHAICMKGFKDIFLLRELVKKYNIQIIHTTLDRADYLGVIVSKLSGCPVVSTMMVPRYHGGFRFADKVVVLSKKQRDLLIEKGVRPEKICIIRPGIDVDRFANPDSEKSNEWRLKLKADDYSIIFCHIASIIPRKAQNVSLDIICECKKRGENPLLIVIGDPLKGEYYELLSQKITQCGLERNAAFTGWTSDIPEILSLSHFTMLPSENEALGIVLMEGMAAGTPIIARENEGGAELVEECGTGFFYKPEEGVRHIVDKLIDLRRDDSRYQVMSDTCRRIAATEFTLQRFGERLMELYGKSKAGA
jgi:glycosyltransferase involved in cell wall biosynthesis